MEGIVNGKILAYSLVFVLAASSNLIAQENNSSDLPDFKIIIEKTEGGINMTCIQGCEWFGLTFDLDNERPRVIDQNGVSELEEPFSESIVDPALFLFTANKIKASTPKYGLNFIQKSGSFKTKIIILNKTIPALNAITCV